MVITRESTLGYERPVAVFDAKGIEHINWLEADTKTGRIKKIRCNDRGVPITEFRDGKVVNIIDEIFASAPLQIVNLSFDLSETFVPSLCKGTMVR